MVHIKRDSLIRLPNKIPLDNAYSHYFKRTFDIAFSFFVLFTIFPILYIVVAIAIKITSPGPIFFKQIRTGLNGHDFVCYKFRSMKVNNEADTLQASANDTRKTRIGNFIRKTNLDEFPQFWNVLIGNMSVIGPRPHMLKHTEDYSVLIDNYMTRHAIKPGITGLAQVCGYRGETDRLHKMVCRVRLDIWYIENWSFGLDVLIIRKTIKNLFRGEKNAN